MLVNVFLVDTLDTTIGNTCRADIVNRVTALLQPCYALANDKIKKPDEPHSFKVAFATTRPTPSDTDLIVYFLPQTFYSIVTYSETQNKVSNLMGSHWGYTKLTPASGTTPPLAKIEIITQQTRGDILGSLVVHELLHAKTGKGNDALHNHGGGGLAAASVEGDTALTAQNKADIAGTITKRVTPWLGGWDILESAKKRRDAGDQFWDQF